MTLNHIIIEGPDASGKDGLISHLLQELAFLDFKLHPRASTSLGGPVPDLARWVSNDLTYLVRDESSTHWIYNRHPLISERIYAPVRDVNRGYVPMFGDQGWVERQKGRMAKQALLVVVQPPFHVIDEIMGSQGSTAHMPGVFNNRLTIYNSYKNIVWPGSMIRYDRTQTSVSALIRLICIAMGVPQ